MTSAVFLVSHISKIWLSNMVSKFSLNFKLDKDEQDKSQPVVAKQKTAGNAGDKAFSLGFNDFQ